MQIPCNFCSPFGLLSDLRKLSVAAFLREQIASFRRLKSM